MTMLFAFTKLYAIESILCSDPMDCDDRRVYAQRSSWGGTHGSALTNQLRPPSFQGSIC